MPFEPKIIKKIETIGISVNFFIQLVEFFEFNQWKNADSGEGCQVFNFDADFSDAWIWFFFKTSLHWTWTRKIRS